MKLFFLLFCAIFMSVSCQDVGPIEWGIVRPVWRTTGFIETFPVLHWLLTRDWGNSNNPDSFISGGSIAEETQFPWSAGLLFHLHNSNAFCSGALISNQWIITAAHCASLSTTGIAILGAHNVMDAMEVNQRRIFINEFFVHPNWDPQTLISDIALIRLPAPVALNANIRPIRLPTWRQMESLFTNQRATVAGWGSTSNMVFPMLRFVQAPVLTVARCSLNYPTFARMFNICTSGADGRSPCRGDSGAALSITEGDGQDTIIGILSFGSTMGCQSGRPPVYTRTTPFLQWISTVTGITIGF